MLVVFTGGAGGVSAVSYAKRRLKKLIAGQLEGSKRSAEQSVLACWCLSE